MDTPKLVKRTQTLKIKNYGGTPDKAANAGSSNQPKKSTSKELQTKSKPRRSVILKSVQELTPGLNARDERLLKVLSSQPDQPLIEINTSGDSGCSSSSDNFQVLAVGDLPLSRQELIDDTENTPPTSRQQNKTSLHDPTDIYQLQAVTQQKNKRTVGNGAIMEEERCKTPKNAMLCSMNSNENFPVTPSALQVDSRLLTRIQHDLNSPSASIRIRALKAIRSPAKSSYAHFDVSYTEQSLITEAERHPPKPKSIEELMQDIVVYVEVRSGEDNRSAGVKKVISSLGAKVNDRLLRNTTHVIFKDGLLSTYKKAKYWNIPVVSILWIEACKNHRRICDVNEFPISNLDRYENPELYGKVKRYKIIQSDSDVHKRVAHKAATTPKPTTPKTTTPRTGNSKKNHVVNAETPKASSIKKKTDIRDFFTKLNDNNKLHPKPSGRNLFGSPKTSKVPSKEKVTESHAVQKLNKSGNVSTFQETNLNSVAKAHKTENPLLQSVSADFDTAFQHIKSVVNNHNALQRSLENTITAVQDMSLDQMPVPESSKSDTPINRTERRRSIRISAYASASKDKEATDFAKKYQREDKIAEEYENNAAAARSNRKRKTNYTPKAMDISELENSEPELVIESGSKQKDADSTDLAHQDFRTPTKESASDVTLHNCSLTAITAKLAQINKDMEMLKPTSHVVVASSLSDISQSECTMQTPPQETGSLLEQHASVNVFSSTRLPGRRRTLFDVSMDIITQRLQNINNSARRSVARTNLHEKTTTTSDSPMLYEKTSTSGLPKQTSDVSESLKLTEEQKPHAADDCSSDKTDKPSESTAMFVATKKRKLFDPNEYPSTPPTATVSTTSIVSKTSASARRRRTLMPLPQAELESKTDSSTTGDTEKLTIKRTRRSTMDFEDTKKVKMNLVTLKKFTKLARETNAAAMAEYKRDVDALRLQEGVTVGDSAASSPRSIHLPEMEQHRTPTVLVYTNMHAEQVKTIREALAKLGHFELENEVNNRTTHIVSLEPRRTMNMLRALLRGLWILQYNWITDSLLAGKWLNEEPYEMRDFSRSVEICRSERQAFGKEYSCELFSMLGPFYVPIRCGRLHKDNLVELIELSGGKIVEQRRCAKYIVGNANKTVEDKVYITPNWIVDSITQMQCQRFGKYTKNKKTGSTGSQPSDVKLQNVWQPNLPK